MSDCGGPKEYTGLFLLWASYQTDKFYGVMAASPSVWYAGWMEYIKENECKAKVVYLSLGNKEHKQDMH